MAPQDPCPCCNGAGTVLIKHEGQPLPDLVTCYLCGGSGLLDCAQCLDSGEIWVDTESGCEFDHYCTCTAGRTLARQHCQVQRVMATSVPYYEERAF